MPGVVGPVESMFDPLPGGAEPGHKLRSRRITPYPGKPVDPDIHRLDMFGHTEACIGGCLQVLPGCTNFRRVEPGKKPGSRDDVRGT